MSSELDALSAGGGMRDARRFYIIGVVDVVNFRYVRNSLINSIRTGRIIN